MALLVPGVAPANVASTQLQSYSALPLNVTSGVTTVQGTPGRPLADGASLLSVDVRTVTFIPRNAGIGSDFFMLNARLSRSVALTGRVRLEALVEGSISRIG